MFTNCSYFGGKIPFSFLEGTNGMHEKKTSLFYRFLKKMVRLLYPKIEVVGEENLPEEPAVIVGNHCQLHGPIASELYFPGKRYTWCAWQMMHREEVPAYAYKDFWPRKPKFSKPFYKLLSHLIAPLSACVFNNADTIAVYHDTRAINTFKQSVRCLQEGARVVVFPEHDVEYNSIVYEFQDKFIDVARLYYKKTGKALAFVPLYIAPGLKKMYLGKPVWFRPQEPMEEERQRICRYLMTQITRTARSLPLHTVVPYRNIRKKDYPTNLPQEVAEHEKTSG